ncbi:Protein cordon-bleu, partial [Stylophora pistillata]
MEAFRVPTSKQRAPLPPQKVLKCNPEELEIHKDDIPQSYSASHRKALLKQSRDQAKEPQALMFRKLDGQKEEQTKTVEEQKMSLSHAGENLLATFYGMLYTNDSTERDWKLEVDGFIPICFVQVQGNANKPFQIIAVEKSRRIMEYQVNTNTTCARNSTFVKWQDGLSMFGVRFAKEDQAEQAVIGKMSDPASSNIHHTKVSLMIKLPDKQTTVVSVPGLLTMSELFEEICEREHLNPNEHQLCLPRTGARKVTFESGTAVGSLKIREVAIIRTGALDNSVGNVEVDDESVEDLLDAKEEESKVLQLIFPSGIKKSYRVCLDMTVKQLVMRVCSRENLNPRHHSLQYIDFKHEFIDTSSTVDEIEVKQVRLMDKRVLRRNSGNTLTITNSSVTDDDATSNDPLNNTHLRKSCGDEMEADNSLPGEDKESKITLPQRSKSLEGLSDDKHENAQKHSSSNGCVPPSMRRMDGEHSSSKKPPIRPLQPQSSKSVTPPKNQTGHVSNGALKELPLSPLKSDIMYASSPELSVCSKKSNESLVFNGNIKTSTPDTKRKRRAAPPPPPRPAAPKALFTEKKTDIHANGAAVKTNPPSMASSTTPQVSAASDGKLKTSNKKRPAPPRPDRPPPPQLAPRLTTQGSQGRKDVAEDKREKDASVLLEQNKGITRRPDRLPLPPKVERHRSDSQEEVVGNNRRGLPIFIPPPPPDELPPPLDECETPVGPLTDIEADILEGAVTDGFPMTMNGLVGIHEIGMFAVSGINDARAQAIQAEPDEEQESKEHRTPKAKQEVSLAPAPEQETLPVVPPPPFYSEPESLQDTTQLNADKTPLVPPPVVPKSVFDDIPPPVIEAQTVQTGLENDVKDHDSGFDQGPESLIITPPLDQAKDVPLEHREDPDSGSSLDVVSTIPPPADFETRPLTPPCQFANPTMAPPEEFIYVEDGKNEEELPKEEKLGKKLNINEGLLPWVDETQASFDATIPPEVSNDRENEWVVVTVNTEESTPINENQSEHCVYKEAVETKSLDISRAIGVTDVFPKPTAQEGVNNHGEVSTAPEIFKNAERTTVTEKQSLGIQRSISSDKNKDMVTSQTIDVKESCKVESNEVILKDENSRRGEQSGSKQFSNTIVKPVEPEGGSISIVRETEIQVKAGVNIQQYSLPALTEDVKQDFQVKPAKPALQVKPPKPDLQVKPGKPEVKEKPVTIIQEAVVKVVPEAVNLRTELERPDPQEVRGNFEKHSKPEKPEIKAKPVAPVKEAEGMFDVQRNAPLEAAKQEPGVKMKQPKEIALNSEKLEARAKPSHLVRDKEFSDINSNAVVIKVESLVRPEELESNVELASVTEAEVKVDTQHVRPLSFNSAAEAFRPNVKIPPVEQDQQVKAELPEQVTTYPIEEVTTQQSKPEVQMCFTTFKEEQNDHPTALPQSEPPKEVTVAGQTLFAQETPLETVSVERIEVVAEAPVTPQTKLVSSPGDKFKDLEAKLQKLDEKTVTSSPDFNKLESMAIPAPYKDATPTVQIKDPFSEDIIVAEMKEVESSDYEYYEALFKMETAEKSSGEVSTMQSMQKGNVVTERQPSVQDSFTTHMDLNSELSLDFKSFRQSPELPRPPSSSPPSVSPRGSTLPSPTALNSDRSTDSGFSPSEEPKGPASPDRKTFEVNSLSTSGTMAVQAQTVSTTPSEERRPKSVQAFSATQTDVKVDTGSVQVTKPHLSKRPVEVSSKLQRPLSMPAGIVTGDLKSEVVQDYSKITEAQARKSSSSYSTDGSSPSPGSSPVDSSKTELVDLPKPPPFTVPPLRRYSDLAADLSFISSAAKAAEKSNVSESKVDVPAKPPNLLLKRNPGTAVERPRSWVGPETDNKKKPLFGGSAFKPVSFNAQGKKSVRPIEFQVKSFTPPSAAPKQATSSSTSYADSATSVHSTFSVTERVGDNAELEKTSKPAPSVRSKPTVAKRTASRVSSLPQEELSSHQHGKPVPKLERSTSIPETKKTEPIATKYEIVYSNKHSTSQGSSKDTSDRGSRSDLPSPVILRDQTVGPSGVTPGRPHSAILTGSKFHIIPADEKLASRTVATDANKPATVQPKGVSWTQAKHQTNEENKPVLQPSTTTKPLPSAKTAAGADTKPLPAVVRRAKAENFDPTKRHSLPSYVIEGADGKKSSIKKSGNVETKFHFIVKEADTDTTVVPRGVVAAMKALREQQGTPE